MSQLKVEETPKSRRGETWTYAGGEEIKKEGKVTIHWTTGSGVPKKGGFKVGSSVPHAHQCRQVARNGTRCDSHEESCAHHQCQNRGSYAAQEKQRYVHLGHVDVISDEPIKN